MLPRLTDLGTQIKLHRFESAFIRVSTGSRYRRCCNIVYKTVNMRHIVISDFDETITTKDTISVLGKIPYWVKPGTEPPWEHYSDTYYQCWKKYHSKNQDLRTLPLISAQMGCIDRDSYPRLFKDEIEFQRNNRAIELASTMEMSKRGLFRGVTHSNIRDYVREHLQDAVRDGMFRCIDEVGAQDFYILSVNWSREFIHAVGRNYVPYSNIFCNNLLSDGDTYTGEFENEVLCGSDKIAKLGEIIETRLANATGSVWYIGDSETDLLSILYPGINGVLLLDPLENPDKFEKLVRQVLGVDEPVVQEYLHGNRQWAKCLDKDDENGLYLARSWDGIRDLLSHM